VPGPSSSAASPLVDDARLAELRADWGDLLDQLVDLFAQTTPEGVAELRAAVGAGDAAALRGVAHRLKGGCQNVGATRLALACRALEESAAAAEADVDALEALVAPTLAALRGA
jgi:HPt (histidine-containing phosphotransfer) domain-containing protein